MSTFSIQRLDQLSIIFKTLAPTFRQVDLDGQLYGFMNSTEPLQSEPATVGSSSHSDKLETGVHNSAKNIVQDALGANKRLQLILAERAEQLEAELREADRLLEVSNTDEGDDDPENEVLIPGAKKATGLLPSSEFLNQSSPFHEEAQKRSNYVANTTPHPIKAKDLETLAGAVRQENQRLQACACLESRLDVNIDLDNNLEGLDWTRISEKVSDASSVRRTSTECRVAWMGDRHPAINHAEWSTAEIGKLNAIVSEYSKVKIPVDWVKVAERLATHRTPIDCMRHGLPPHRHSWSPEADKKLIKAVETCGIDNWQLVARSVSEYATAGQCQGRWQKTLDPVLKRGAWTEEEDERLRKAVAGYGKSWMQVSSAIPGRTNDQCRERWTEHINYTSAKIKWSEEEDKHLTELVEELGKHWKAIGLKIGGNKTGQNCRLRYDKLNRVPSKFKNTPEGTPSLSVVNSAAIFNVAGPSQLVSTQIPEAVSTTFTFSTNLGQHSFSQPSNPSNSFSVAVDKPHAEPHAVEGNDKANESLPLDHTTMCPPETTEQGMETSDQLCAMDDTAHIPKKSGKKAPEISSTNSTKPRPKPRPRASKMAGRAMNPPTEALDTPIIPILTPDLAQLPSSSRHSTLETTKVSAPKKGTKRKTAETPVDEKDKQPQKKARMSATAPPVGTDKAREFFLEASKASTTLAASATTIDMRTRASPGIPNSGPAIHAHESATDISHLRRGRSRRVETTPDDNTLGEPGPPPSAKIYCPPPKKSRGRPRKVQAS